jgi:hypothetical protein
MKHVLLLGAAMDLVEIVISAEAPQTRIDFGHHRLAISRGRP